MEREQLQHLLRQKPFQPFRVFLRDGRTFDIRYPRMNLLARTYVNIGIPEAGTPLPLCDHTEFVRLSEIARVEMLSSEASSLPS